MPYTSYYTPGCILEETLPRPWACVAGQGSSLGKGSACGLLETRCVQVNQTEGRIPIELTGLLWTWWRGDPLLGVSRRGYETLAPWPEQYAGRIDTFGVGRLFWVANYVARYQRQYLREHVDWTAMFLERFLEAGPLRKA